MRCREQERLQEQLDEARPSRRNICPEEQRHEERRLYPIRQALRLSCVLAIFLWPLPINWSSEPTVQGSDILDLYYFNFSSKLTDLDF